MLSFTKHAFENETQVLYISLEDEDVSHIQVDLLSGTDNETSSKDYEIAHFLEHLNAQLTSSDRRNSLEIAQELESVGIRWNAFTSPHRTGYFMVGPSRRISLMIDVLLSTFYDFQIDRNLFFQEKQAVIQELTRRASSAWLSLRESHYASLFPNHPRSKLLKERIRNVTTLIESDLLDFRRRHYLPSNTFITVAHSARNKIAVLGQIGSFVGRVQPSRSPAPEFPRLKPAYRRFAITHVPIFGTESTRIFISYKIPYTAFDFEENVTMRAIALLLTRGFSSRLYDKLRRQKGFIYSVRAYPLFDPIDKNMSHLLIDTTTFHKNIADTILITINALTQFAKEGITGQEFDKYKKNIRMVFAENELILHPSKWVSNLTNYFIWNKEILDDATEEKIALSITQETIQRLAREIFVDNPQIVVTYGGPIKMHV